MSSITKKYRFWFVLLTAISICLTFGPLAVYACIGMAKATAAQQCIFMSCVGVATIISLVCVINKYTPRSRLFFFIFGLYFIIEHFIPCLMVLGACCIADEFIICPIKNWCGRHYEINKEIDKRIP